MQHTGIYMISCPNDRKYIGQSKFITRRWQEHNLRLGKGLHDNVILQNIYNKYGKESLEYSILEICGEEELNSKEEYWVNTIPEDRRVNIGRVGNVIKVSDSTKAKLSNKAKARWTEEYRANHSVAIDKIEKAICMLYEDIPYSEIENESGISKTELKEYNKFYVERKRLTRASLDETTVGEIRHMITKGLTDGQIAKELEIRPSNIYQIHIGKTYRISVERIDEILVEESAFH